MDPVVKCSVFLRNINDIAEMSDVYVRYFSNRKPARTTTQATLIDPFNLEIDAVAELPSR
ncbi:MAG: Rid family hydrolase [Pyrinomonadaceae bacterium]